MSTITAGVTNPPTVSGSAKPFSSSQIAAYLNMLGYEALSLSFGSNALFYDSLTSHKWANPATDFPLVTD